MERTGTDAAASEVREGLHVQDHRREIASMIRRLQDEHAAVPVSVIADLVHHHFAALESAKVQTFRAILTERAVRNELRATGAAWTP